MLRKEQNDLLTQTGPGTAMGQMFRSHWIPNSGANSLKSIARTSSNYKT